MIRSEVAARCGARTREPHTATRAVSIVLAAWLCAAVAATSSFAADGEASARVYLDPVTGQVTLTPSAAALELSPAEVNMLSTSDEGLAIRRSRGSGLSVDLQGRFRQMSVATIGSDGRLRIDCAGRPGAASAEPVHDHPAQAGAHAHRSKAVDVVGEHDETGSGAGR